MILSNIIDLFNELDPDERLEVLIDYGRSLSPLPEEYRTLRDAGLHIVRECQAPVFFWVDITEDGTVHIEADVPVEAGIARGFAAMLKGVFNGKSVPAQDEIPDDMLQALAIDRLLGMQRRKGLMAVYNALTEKLPR